MFRRRAKQRATELTLFYASDLHGSDVCFAKFVNAAAFYGARVLVLGGDLAGKAVVPIVRRNGGWAAEFIGRTYALESEADVEELERSIRYNGFYPYRASQDEVEAMAADEAHLKAVFERLMVTTLERWLARAEERLAGSGVELVAIAGNDDEPELDDVLRSSGLVRFNDETPVEIDGYVIVGLSWGNPTPWNSPRELPEDELYERIRRVVETVDVGPKTIFNFHVPPHGSGIDEAPELDEDYRFALSGGHPRLIPVGSTAIRRIFEECQPGLGLHGHIHESRGYGRIGRSVVINPGSRYNEGVLDGVLVTLGKDGVHDYQLLTG